MFALVIFKKREKLFISETQSHAVKVLSLLSRLKRDNLPQPPYFGKFFFAESALDNEKPVDMPKQGVVIVDRCDKRHTVAEFVLICSRVLRVISHKFKSLRVSSLTGWKLITNL